MNENIQEFLISGASIFIFLMAIALFFNINKGIEHMNDASNKAQASVKTLYESQIESEEAYVTGAQIIYCIQEGLEKDIQIGATTVSKDIDESAFDYSIIDVNRSYLVVKTIDAVGYIDKVIYYKK